MTTRNIFFCASMLAATSDPSIGLAQAPLQQANPAAGEVVKASPTEIRLKFSAPVRADASMIALSSRGPSVSASAGSIHGDPADPSAIEMPIPRPLSPGVYTVTWSVVSGDSSIIRGSYQFDFRP
jgi:copper resistance protein C